MLDGRSASAADGLTDALLEAEREGSISSEEMRATGVLLYSLGHMDVGYLVAAGLRVFAELPEVYVAFRENEEFRDAIIHEIVRMDPPELSFYRTTLEDVIIRGVHIPAYPVHAQGYKQGPGVFRPATSLRLPPRPNAQ